MAFTERLIMYTCVAVSEMKQLYLAGFHGQIEPMVKWWYFFNCHGLS